jgi:hypothetical protein
VLAIAGAGVLTSCERAPAARSNDTVVTTPTLPPAPESAVARVSPWDSAAGPALLVAGTAAGQGSAVLPMYLPDADLANEDLDASMLRGRRFDLIANGAVVGRAVVGPKIAVDIPEDCSAWPTVRLTAPGDSASRPWALGLAAGRAAPVPFDSLAALPAPDSSRLAIILARLASGMPGDTVVELRGLPYKVRRAYRFSVAPGTDGTIAEIIRTLNQEASPKQEHLLLIAERDSTHGGQYSVAYAERQAGTEETLESTELLGIVRIVGSRHPSLVVARYVGDGVVYSLLERVGAGRWRARWTSPYVGC